MYFHGNKFFFIPIASEVAYRKLTRLSRLFKMMGENATLHFFDITTREHGRNNLRNLTNLSIIACVKERNKQLIQHHAVNQFNKLPNYVRHEIQLGLFKNKLKNISLNQII